MLNELLKVIIIFPFNFQSFAFFQPIIEFYRRPHNEFFFHTSELQRLKS